MAHSILIHFNVKKALILFDKVTKGTDDCNLTLPLLSIISMTAFISELYCVICNNALQHCFVHASLNDNYRNL